MEDYSKTPKDEFTALRVHINEVRNRLAWNRIVWKRIRNCVPKGEDTADTVPVVEAFDVDKAQVSDGSGDYPKTPEDEDTAETAFIEDVYLDGIFVKGSITFSNIGFDYFKNNNSELHRTPKNGSILFLSNTVPLSLRAAYFVNLAINRKAVREFAQIFARGQLKIPDKGFDNFTINNLMLHRRGTFGFIQILAEGSFKVSVSPNGNLVLEIKFKISIPKEMFHSSSIVLPDLQKPPDLEELSPKPTVIGLPLKPPKKPAETNLLLFLTTCLPIMWLIISGAFKHYRKWTENFPVEKRMKEMLQLRYIQFLVPDLEEQCFSQMFIRLKNLVRSLHHVTLGLRYVFQ